MAAAESSLERLRAALAELAGDDVSALLAEARAEAQLRVRSTLADVLTESMLERATAQLTEDGQSSALPPSEPRQEAADERTAFYVYGVLRGEDVDAVHELGGLWGREVAVVHEGHLAAVVSEVPRRDFDESALRTHLADMAWVESVARAHEAVLDELCNRTTVIPMRMCTVYHSRGGVQEMLQREATTLQEALAHLDGRREWGVQAFFSRSKAARNAESLQEPGDGPSTGTGYLERKREERDLELRLDELVDEAVQAIHESLGEIAVESALNSPQRREASGHPGQMVLNGVYLVDDGDQEAFADQVQALGSVHEERGIELVMTGPWPPYNFLPGSIGAAW